MMFPGHLLDTSKNSKINKTAIQPHLFYHLFRESLIKVQILDTSKNSKNNKQKFNHIYLMSYPVKTSSKYNYWIPQRILQIIKQQFNHICFSSSFLTLIPPGKGRFTLTYMSLDYLHCAAHTGLPSWIRLKIEVF